MVTKGEGINQDYYTINSCCYFIHSGYVSVNFILLVYAFSLW